MSVVTAMEEAGPCRLKLIIEVPTPAVEAETGRVLQEFRRHANLPGFRKGKVPAKVIEKRFRSEIRGEVVERLLPRYWEQAKAEKSLDPLLPPGVERLEDEEGEPLRVHLLVETRPEIAIADLDFDLPAPDTEVTEADMEEALLDLRRTFAEWEVVEREAAQGDLVVGSMKVLSGPDHEHDSEDDEAEDGAAAEPEERPLHVEIGGSGVDERLSLELTGKKAGDVVRYTETHGEGEDAHEHEVEIEVREVKEQNLPELDDAMAEKIAGFESVDELKAMMEKSVASRKQETSNRRRLDALLDQLRERHPTTLPEGVVQQERERMVQEQAERLAQQGVDLEKAQIDWQGMFGALAPMAEQRVHERLVLDAVAKHLSLRLDEEKFEQFLAMAASQQNVSSMALRQRLTEDGRIEGLRAQLLRDQTLQHLLGETDDDEEESTEASTAEEAEDAGTDNDGTDNDETENED